MINNSNDGYGQFGSNRLLDDLIDFCFSIDGSKLLLIGDDAQLPPVGTEMSPALIPEYLVGFCASLYQGVLKDIVRQEDGGEIVYLSYLLRGQIIDLQNGKDWQEPLLPISGVKGEVQIVSGYDLPELIEDSYQRWAWMRLCSSLAPIEMQRSLISLYDTILSTMMRRLIQAKTLWWCETTTFTFLSMMLDCLQVPFWQMANC